MKDMQSVSVSVGAGGEPELLGVLLTQQRQRTRELCLWPAAQPQAASVASLSLCFPTGSGERLGSHNWGEAVALLCSGSACPWPERAGACLRPPRSGDSSGLGMEAAGKFSGTRLRQEPALATITAAVPRCPRGPVAMLQEPAGLCREQQALGRQRRGHFYSWRKSKPGGGGPAPPLLGGARGQPQAAKSQRPPFTVTPDPCTICSEPRTREGGLTGPRHTGLGLLGVGSSGLPCLERMSGAWSPEGPG